MLIYKFRWQKKHSRLKEENNHHQQQSYTNYSIKKNIRNSSNSNQAPCKEDQCRMPWDRRARQGPRSAERTTTPHAPEAEGSAPGPPAPASPTPHGLRFGKSYDGVLERRAYGRGNEMQPSYTYLHETVTLSLAWWLWVTQWETYQKSFRCVGGINIK